jgi:hypothetical protein
MKRLLLALAAASAVAVAAPGDLRAAPPSDTAPTDGVVVDSPLPSAPVDDHPFGLGVGEEVTHSWALTPAGGDDVTGAGTRPDLSYTGDPGTVIEDAVTLYNLGNQQLTFAVYAADAYNGPDGALDLQTASQTPTDVGSWVRLEQELITVPPGRKLTIPFTLTIPDSARPGDHIGAILAASEAVGPDEDDQLVAVDRRTGTRLNVRVSGPLRAELAITGLAADFEAGANPIAGSMHVRYRIENRGNVRMSGTHVVSASGLFGLGRKSLGETEFSELLPGSSIDVEQSIDGVPTLFVASAEVELEPRPGGDGLTNAPSSRRSTAFAPPIAVLLVVLLAIVAVLFVRARRRHREAPVIAGEFVLAEDVEVVREHQPT